MENIELEQGEKIVLKTRKHWVILARDLGGTLLVALVPFGIWMINRELGGVPSIAATVASLIAFAAILWLLVAWLAAAVIWTDHYLDLWIVTDRRIFHVEQLGLFNRQVATWNMDRIQAVTTSAANILQTLFGYGTIQVQTAGPSDQYATMEGIPRPDAVRAAILGQIEYFAHLAEASEKQEKLLRFVSHEVKGHLAKSKAAFASIIEGDYGNVPQGLKGMAGSALADSEKGVETVMNILDTADFTSGEMRFDKHPFDLVDSVRKTVDDFRAAAAAKGLSLEFASTEEALAVYGDEPKIRRHVIRNLVDNAIHYTPYGSVRAALSRMGDFVHLSVRDSGVGITPEDMQKLFTAGGKGAESSTINKESTGYGLFVAKQVVEAHAGTIKAYSSGAGHGTEFVVELPHYAPPMQ